ncbi:MAG: prepilin-type N-terminal cleavage/methylation domain-containing protein [Candidatus Hydrogenedentes bacterium]|nr:prepilin-type N-terminal cleavage/methylation domain-containing protein [Candidatus Hydrogenedentota bacterium]
MSNRRSNHHGSEGFTLIEIMIALAILGTSLFVLLDMHYNAVQVQTRLENEVRVRNLLSLAAGISEVEVAAGNLNGSEEFGDRYPGWSYAFEAEEVEASTSRSTGGADTPAFPGLYYVAVNVLDPDNLEHSLEYYTVVRTQVTAQGNSDDDDDDSGTGGLGSGGSGSGGSGSGGSPASGAGN